MIFEDAPSLDKLSARSLWFLQQLEAGVSWPEECVAWPWRDGDRRHTMYFRGKAMPVTHVVLTFTEGERPSRTHQGLHSCDVSWCINGKHLRWGTELENRLDQSDRARGDIGRVGLETARSIRLDLEQISSNYGVPMDAIQRIAGGKTWAEDSWTDAG